MLDSLLLSYDVQLSLVCFVLAWRNSLGQQETDVFEAASVAAAAVCNDLRLFTLLSSSLAPISHCVIGGSA
ncbi:hypothetical protein B0T25DRAFT_550928 [Lasiosphaeria hispida]|uniref:Secreted protein n=1 Tax=Lasiosphaeria hispida TaxID=260671 RepID=A0AAJ0HAK7_9PEZI|nr:hypothetical protein B0T25DRAFT_550928 [Lasiosphaeria hispida]